MTKEELIRAWSKICYCCSFSVDYPTKEMDTIADALIAYDKYRWHDLRKNPNDLPPRAISIAGTRTCHESDEVLAQDGVGYYFIAEYNHDAGEWVDTADHIPMKKGRLIAWREIEPFEVSE